MRLVQPAASTRKSVINESGYWWIKTCGFQKQWLLKIIWVQLAWRVQRQYARPYRPGSQDFKTWNEEWHSCNSPGTTDIKFVIYNRTHPILPHIIWSSTDYHSMDFNPCCLPTPVHCRKVLTDNSCLSHTVKKNRRMSTSSRQNDRMLTMSSKSLRVQDTGVLSSFNVTSKMRIQQPLVTITNSLDVHYMITNRTKGHNMLYTWMPASSVLRSALRAALSCIAFRLFTCSLDVW